MGLTGPALCVPAEEALLEEAPEVELEEPLAVADPSGDGDRYIRLAHEPESST